ncbi:SurA N-terminal domain-containing protein [Aeromicrobium sp. CF3.5]|uniref:SurA N-terminal domain-containing protein n=1 Tax=Aeromicrobium sp. CF3.5 TaxID=3373078 RepID=UPI003EE7DFD0
MSLRKRIVAVAATALLSAGVLGACGGSEESPSDSASDSPASSEPDLDGVPDVVAVVDDTEITKEEFAITYEAQFTSAAAQAQAGGEPVDQDALKKRTADALVDTQLLLNEADARGYEVSQEDLDSTLAALAEQNGLSSPDELVETLTAQGLDEAEIDSQLERQVKLDRLTAEEAGDSKPSEEDLRTVYDDVVEQQRAAAEGAEEGAEAPEVPSFEDARPQLEQQVQQENENSAAQALVDELKKDADITINL